MLRDIHRQVSELQAEASEARTSPYNNGYLDALAAVLEIVESVAWDSGMDLSE